MFKIDQREVDFDCEKHGKIKVNQHYFAGKWHDPKCPKCAEEQKAKEEREAKEREEREKAERKRRRIEANIGRAMIPLRFQQHTFETYKTITNDQKEKKRICEDYAKNFEEANDLGRCMIFYGNTGTGKTHLACAIANSILKRDYTTVYIGLIDVINSVKRTYSTNSDKSEQEVIDSLSSPDLLILDEIGVQFNTDTEKLILFEIINNRYEAIKPTIIISNRTAAELGEFVGERVIDRMRENGGKLLNFDWQSHRKTRND